MSHENVEIVRSIYAAWERGDFTSAEWAHPEIAFVVADGPTPGSWTGRGKTSGLDVGETAMKGLNVFHVRGGRVTRLVLYWDRERALADLGLAPESEE